MAYFIGLTFIAAGLAISIPAFITWIELISSFNIEQAFSQATPIFTQLIIGSLLVTTGIGIIVWKTINNLTTKSPPSISIDNSPGVTLTLAGRDAAVTNTIHTLQVANDSNTRELANLLIKLQTAIKTDSSLTSESKLEALEQVKVLGEVAKSPRQTTNQQMAKTAIRVLKGMMSELPNAVKFIEACNQLLPIITKLLGLGF
jgi:hypothetical protein